MQHRWWWWWWWWWWWTKNVSFLQYSTCSWCTFCNSYVLFNNYILLDDVNKFIFCRCKGLDVLIFILNPILLQSMKLYRMLSSRTQMTRVLGSIIDGFLAEVEWKLVLCVYFERKGNCSYYLVDLFNIISHKIICHNITFSFKLVTLKFQPNLRMYLSLMYVNI